MPRHMSFAITKAQILDHSKTVTRRFGWWSLTPNTRLWAVEKSMGLRKGQKARKLRMIQVTSTRSEPLNAITAEDVVREGFPEMTPQEFVEMLCEKYGCGPGKTCNRIEFTYVGVLGPHLKNPARGSLQSSLGRLR